MEIRQLRAFMAIAETGTFTSGARRVHITQAAISMQIQQLETELGVKLFTRMPRKVLLTEAGEKLLNRATALLAEHDRAVTEIAQLAGAERGRLRLGSASSGFSASWLPKILVDLRLYFPAADVSVISGTSDSLVAHILSGELDLAFVSLPVEAQGIRTELLSRDELVAIASPRHHLARQRVVTASALASEKLILGERGGNTRRLIDQFFEESGLEPTVVMELSRADAIKRMVEADMGVGIVPSQSASEEIARGRLVSWWIKGASRVNWELGLAMLADGYDSPILNTFLKLCKVYFTTEAHGRMERRSKIRE